MAQLHMAEQSMVRHGTAKSQRVTAAHGRHGWARQRSALRMGGQLEVTLALLISPQSLAWPTPDVPRRGTRLIIAYLEELHAWVLKRGCAHPRPMLQVNEVIAASIDTPAARTRTTARYSATHTTPILSPPTATPRAGGRPHGRTAALRRAEAAAEGRAAE